YNGDPDREQTRSGPESNKGATIEYCTFRGFRNPTGMNAWGLYFKNTENNTVENCKFSDNTTYDIAIVDNVHRTTIRNVDSEDGTGCKLVIEPNGVRVEDKVSYTTIENSNFSLLGIMENSSPFLMVTGTTIRNCKTDALLLQGGDMTRIENVEF